MKPAFTNIRWPVIVATVFAALGLAALYAMSGFTAKERVGDFAVGTLQGLDASGRGAPPSQSVFVDANGTRLALNDFTGQIILVNFWATWCAPCEREIPSLAALQAARGGPSFKIVAISVDDPDDRDHAVRRLEQLGGGALDFYRLADGPEGWNIIYDSGGGGGFPTTIFYDRRAIQVAKLEGEADWSRPEVLALIDFLVSESGQPS